MTPTRLLVAPGKALGRVRRVRVDVGMIDGVANAVGARHAPAGGRRAPDADRVRSHLRARPVRRRRWGSSSTWGSGCDAPAERHDFLPLVGVAVLLLAGASDARRSREGRRAGDGACSRSSCPLAILGRFDGSFGGFQLVEHATWVKGVGLSYLVGIDGISLWMVLLTTFLLPIAILASWKIDKERAAVHGRDARCWRRRYLGSFVALDLLLFFVFFEAMLVPMYLLIGGWGGERRIYAAIKFFLFTMAGSAFLLLAIVFLYSIGGPRSGGREPSISGS